MEEVRKTRKVDFKVLSDRKCKHEGCRKQLKQNLVMRNPYADYCYKHWQINVRKSDGYLARLKSKSIIVKKHDNSGNNSKD